MKKLLSALLALCMVISMVTVAAVSVGAAEVGAGAATGASARTIYVGVIEYLTLDASNYQVHYWGGSDGAKDAALTATGKTAQQAVGSAYWSNQPKTFNMYTASIPADATGYKVHNGDTWFGSTDGTPAATSFHGFFANVAASEVNTSVENAFNNSINRIGAMPAPFVKYCSTVWDIEFQDDENWETEE
jgi:hypothetical protein